MISLVSDLAVHDGPATSHKATLSYHRKSSLNGSMKEQSFDIVEKYKFNTQELRATEQKTKHAEVAILASGQVSIAIVGESCRYLISSDGEEIVSIKQDDTRKTYPLADLPARSLLAYRYASKFVNLVRSKTVKIALDSAAAKCRLYQNESFEVVLLKEKRKIAFSPTTKVTKIADHGAVLWKGHLAEVPPDMREIVRQALIWLERCKDVLKDPISEQGADNLAIRSPIISQDHAVCARFIDGLGWCERREEGSLWTLFFLDGVSMELQTDSRTLKITDQGGGVEDYKLENGLPEHIRKRLKMASRAMKEFS